MSSVWRRHRRTVIAVLTITIFAAVALVGVPRILSPPAPPDSLSPISHTILAGSSSKPGYIGVKLPPIADGHTFALTVKTNGTASECVLSESDYNTWVSYWNLYQDPSARYPWSNCVIQRPDSMQDTFSFKPASAGIYYVVTLNKNPYLINAEYLPAS